ncbi:MAG: hypothetical protein ACOC80_06690 [Petrotogales bacterium]
MKNLRGWIGLALVILGIPIALYVGGWVMFVGGIVQIVEAIQCDPVNAIGIALGILRWAAAGTVGVICFWLSFVVGFGLISSN